jgi:hypothetical protein
LDRGRKVVGVTCCAGIRTARARELVMKRRHLPGQRLKLLTVPGKQRRHRLRYLISARRRNPSGRNSRRYMRRMQRRTDALQIRCRRHQRLRSHHQN